MITNPKPITRERLARVTGGRVAIFDCLECADGVYLGSGRPQCTLCGSPMPDDMLEFARSTAVTAAA
jgi:hypothetical protein